MKSNGSGAGRNAYTVASPPSSHESLARPQSIVRLVIYTRDARKLIHGRKAAPDKPAIIGLFGYAERLRRLWEAARASDPYAVWWLVRIEEVFTSTAATIDLERSTVHEALHSALDFDVTLAASEPLCTVELNFTCPYAYWGAKALKTYDQLVVAAAAAERLGLRKRENKSPDRFRCERAIRGLFAAPLGYTTLGLTFDDIKQGSALANDARALMGEVPAAVLSGERLPGLLEIELPMGGSSTAAV